MWKKEDQKSQPLPEFSTSSQISTAASVTSPVVPQTTPAAPPVSPRATACISQGIKIKGDVTGSEDLFIDGLLEGNLDLGNASVTVGPNGNVRADIHAREVIIRGRVEGKISGRERIRLWSTGQVNGDVQTERLAIEDGGVLRGKVEAGKPIAESTANAKTDTAAISKPRDISSTSISSATAAD